MRFVGYLEMRDTPIMNFSNVLYYLVGHIFGCSAPVKTIYIYIEIDVNENFVNWLRIASTAIAGLLNVSALSDIFPVRSSISRYGSPSRSSRSPEE